MSKTSRCSIPISLAISREERPDFFSAREFSEYPYLEVVLAQVLLPACVFIGLLQD
jgi:hypothetical protein